jgi:S-adenosylmethionine hydrolase
MKIITLTTDLGLSDPYVGMVKGTLFRLFPKVQVIDISHTIQNYDIQRCAFLLKWAYPSFPEGSVHIFGCDPSGSVQQGGIAAFFKGHYFVGPDNGIMTLIAGGEKFECRRISNPDLLPPDPKPSFLIQDVYAPAAALLASGAGLDEIGPETLPKDITYPEPVYSDPFIRGHIIHVDHFGNCITNISRTLFSSAKKNRPFKIVFRNHNLSRIFLGYEKAMQGGDPIAVFGSHGNLEICVILGSASSLFGLNVGHSITLEYQT